MEGSVRLWIKGDAKDAQKASVERNIPLTNIHLVDEMSVAKRIIADVDEQHQLSVIQWYCEDSELKEGFGYPPGTLLFYTLR
jgi:hypothetical protein